MRHSGILLRADMEQRVTSILPTMTDESRPDLIISPLIAHLQTPLKILEDIYIDEADKYNKHSILPRLS